MKEDGVRSQLLSVLHCNQLTASLFREVLSAAQQLSSLGLLPPNSPHIEVMLYLDQTDTPVKSKTLTSQNYAPLMR